MKKLSFNTFISFLITSPSPEGLSGALGPVRGWSLNQLRAPIGLQLVAFSPIQYSSASPVQRWWPCFPSPLGQLAETEQKEKAMAVTKDEEHILKHLQQVLWGLCYLLQLLNPSTESFSEWLHFSVHLLSAIINNTSTGQTLKCFPTHKHMSFSNWKYLTWKPKLVITKCSVRPRSHRSHSQDAFFKSWTEFNLSTAFLECRVMRET